MGRIADTGPPGGVTTHRLRTTGLEPSSVWVVKEIRLETNQGKSESQQAAEQRPFADSGLLCHPWLG
jgi:hypothetical protein